MGAEIILSTFKKRPCLICFYILKETILGVDGWRQAGFGLISGKEWAWPGVGQGIGHGQRGHGWRRFDVAAGELWGVLHHIVFTWC